MNPYEVTLPNVVARVGAWCRGLARRYRKTLLVIGAAGATVAVSMGAAEAPTLPLAPIQVAANR